MSAPQHTPLSDVAPSASSRHQRCIRAHLAVSQHYVQDTVARHARPDTNKLSCRLPTEALSEYDFYMDTHRLRISVSNMKNANTRDKLEAIRVSVLANLSKLPPAPSAPLAPRPPSNFRVRPRSIPRWSLHAVPRSYVAGHLRCGL